MAATDGPPTSRRRVSRHRDRALLIDGRFDLSAHGPGEMPIWGRHFVGDPADPEIGGSVARGNIASVARRWPDPNPGMQQTGPWRIATAFHGELPQPVEHSW